MGKLFIVATPIGNLADITLRAIETLKKVDLIACEDTRHSKILLDKYDIQTPTVSYHQHSRLTKIDYLISQLKLGKDIALITDAGTPGISDPGQKLIKGVMKHKIETVAIPGPSAIIAALSICGFNLHQFLYLGFLPKKKGRKTLLESLKKEKRAIVFYESPYRIVKTLNELKENLGDRKVVVVRELTKKFEETYRGKLSEVIKKVNPKGEFVVIIKGIK
jgi:16S rRNA (cytidine1402-2'-O)-methyltransferase